MSLLRKITLIELEAQLFSGTLDDVLRMFDQFERSLYDAYKNHLGQAASLTEERDGVSLGQVNDLLKDAFLERQKGLSAMVLALMVAELERHLNQYRCNVAADHKRSESFCKLEKEFSKRDIRFSKLPGYEECLEVVYARNYFIHRSAKSIAGYKGRTKKLFLKIAEPNYSEASEILIVNSMSLSSVVVGLQAFVVAFAQERNASCSTHVQRS